MNLRSPFQGSKAEKVGVAFVRKTSKTPTSQKNPLNPFETKRKVAGKGWFSLVDFLPGV
jgi:hypothetical protein